METAIQKVKQPAPNVSSSKDNDKKYKIIHNPTIGVIQIPKMTNTPLLDWVEIKKKESPQTKYKLSIQDYKLDKLDIISTISIISCAILSVAKLLKKK